MSLNVRDLWRRNAPQQPRSLDVRQVLFTVGACLMILGVGCWREWVAYDQQVRDSKAAVANLASSLVRDAEATVEVADTLVTGIVVRLESEGSGPSALAVLNQMLPARVAEMSRLHSLIVLDANGDWLATSLPKTGPNLSDREQFLHARDYPDRGPVIGSPIFGRVTDRWIITVARRVQSADGQFAGVVFATIEIADFVDHYARMDLGPNSLITLFKTDGSLLARYPWNANSVGRNLSSATVFKALKEKPAGSYETTSVPDGTQRFSGYRQGDRYPLVNVASVSVDHVLNLWRINAALHIGMMFVAIGAIGLLALRLMRQLKVSQAATKASRESEEILDRTGRLAGVGGWELDLVTNEIAWSAETCRIHGLEPGYRPTLEQALNFYAAAARPVISAALETCKLSGDAWDLELPLIRADGLRLWVRAVGSAIFSGGKAIRIAGAFQDVTDQVVKRLALARAQEEILAAGALYQLLANNSTDMIVVIDRHFVRRYV